MVTVKLPLVDSPDASVAVQTTGVAPTGKIGIYPRMSLTGAEVPLAYTQTMVPMAQLSVPVTE